VSPYLEKPQGLDFYAQKHRIFDARTARIARRKKELTLRKK
jgi:hypothetical protein